MPRTHREEEDTNIILKPNNKWKTQPNGFLHKGETRLILPPMIHKVYKTEAENRRREKGEEKEKTKNYNGPD